MPHRFGDGVRRRRVELLVGAMARLEEIVHALEAGNLSLDDSLRVFEEGTGLLRLCTRRLEEAERRIEILMQDETGGTRAEPFRWEEGQG